MAQQPKINAPQVSESFLVKDQWGNIVRLVVCNPGGYFIETFNHMGGTYAGLKAIHQDEAQKLLEKEL